MEDTKENVMDNVLEEPLKLYRESFSRRRFPRPPLTTLWSAEIETMVSRTPEILNEGKRAKCSPLMESYSGLGL